LLANSRSDGTFALVYTLRAQFIPIQMNDWAIIEEGISKYRASIPIIIRNPVFPLENLP
jgi:hypothetical protein